ncbi:MAG: trypsin-like peptidase domain-containing protein, partial [Deltaproteobacteria bacterium]|nr:trypsin-like peptidase domain-containing protein [Deltaproteobacteria bacterium]
MKRTRSLVFVAVWLTISFLGSYAFAGMSPRQIYKTKADGVVLIVASEKGSTSASAGTGSIISTGGKVITNCHVIFDTTKKAPFSVVNIFLKPAKVTGNMNKDLTRHFTAKVLAYDEALDLAILQINKPPRDLTVMTLGDPEELGPGDETIAIGHPEQGGLWTITTGVIGTQFEDFKGVPGKHVFQMETSLNRGNSGGPLFDIRGYQVGVNTAIARKGQGGVAITGVNFAVKASVVKKFASKHRLELAYGGQKLLEEQDTRVAVADAPKAKTPEKTPVPPPPDKVEKTVPPEKTDKKVYGSKSTTGGTITVEDGDTKD